MPADPLVTDKERVDMTVHEIWKVTVYRFTYRFIMFQNNPELMNDIVNSVKDHPSIKHSYKSRLWCSQDDGRKKKRKPKEGKNIEHRDHACMSQFKCKSQLIISCSGQDLRTIKV